MAKPRRTKSIGRMLDQGSDISIVKRLPLVDALRGGALLAMILYHFGFDLNYLGWIHHHINTDPGWLSARTLILGTFLFTVGTSLALAERQQKSLGRKLLRIGKISAAALLVTTGSWLIFPASAIYFGTLHAIALMSLTLSLLPIKPLPASVLGVAAIALGNAYGNAVFDHPGLAWLGLMTHKPLTEDYVPMLPWFGVCLIGYAATKAFARGPLFDELAKVQPKTQLLAWLGRHSLAIYLLHQPLLLGILIPATRLFRPS